MERDYSEPSYIPSVQALDEVLTQAGWTGLDLSSEDTVVASLVKTVYTLLGQQNVVIRMKDDYEDRIRRITLDYQSTNFKKEQYQAKFEKSQRELNRLFSKEKSSSKEIETLKKDLSQAREESKLLHINHISCKNQFSHALRKRDVEVAAIKERAQKIIGNKFKSAGINCVGLNLPRTNPEKDTEDYYTEVVRGYHVRESTLARENQCLREAVTTIVNRTQKLLNPNSDSLPWSLSLEDSNKIESELEEMIENLDGACHQSKAHKSMHHMATQTIESSLEKNILSTPFANDTLSNSNNKHTFSNTINNNVLLNSTNNTKLSIPNNRDIFPDIDNDMDLDNDLNIDDLSDPILEMTPHTVRRLDRQEQLVQFLVRKNRLLQEEIKKTMNSTKPQTHNFLSVEDGLETSGYFDNPLSDVESNRSSILMETPTRSHSFRGKATELLNYEYNASPLKRRAYARQTDLPDLSSPTSSPFHSRKRYSNNSDLQSRFPRYDNRNDKNTREHP